MFDQMRAFIVANPFLAAALSSFWGAVLFDLVAFSNSKDPSGWLKGWDWRVAVPRYLQALVGGFAGNFVTAGVVAGAGAITALAIWLAS